MTTILVIENEAAICDIITDILLGQGFDVLVARDGEEGVAIAMERLPSLILCDVGMPVLDGYGVLTRIRENPDTVAIPFIFLTAYSSVKDVRQGMSLGADDYLVKPFTADDLLRAIRTRLEKTTQLKAYYESSLDELRRNITVALPHEFRTPLVGILGASEFLLADFENLDADIIRELLTDIYNSGDRLHRLIQKYLCYVHLQDRFLRGTGDTCLLGEDLGAVITETSARVLRGYQRQDDLRLVMETEILVLTSSDCRQLLEELLDNAAKFSTANTPILLKVYEAEGQDHIVLTDYGRGMSDKELANIGAYQQFKRDQYEQQGAGLGLAIAQLLTNIYKGTLTLTSAPDKGTTVHIRLPHAPKNQTDSVLIG